MLARILAVLAMTVVFSVTVDSAERPTGESTQVQTQPEAAEVKKLIDRGNSLSEMGKLDQAIQNYDEAIRLQPESARAFFCRGTTRYQQGEYDRAVEDLTESIRLNPKSTHAFNNRGSVWRAKQEIDKAITDYTEAIRLDPKHAGAYSNRGLAWAAKQKWERAIQDYDKATLLRPRDPGVSLNRGIAWEAKGEYERALADCTLAITLDPKYAAAYFSRARIRAECSDTSFRDGAKAIEDAKRACELSKWKEPHHLSVLAAAYAEAGDYPAAVKWLEKAMEYPAFAKSGGDRAKKRMEFYKAKKRLP